MKLPTDVARNQMPIISPPMRGGASTVIALKPTGLRHNSPMVWRKYVAVSHIGLASCPLACAGGIRITKPRPTSSSPHANFIGDDGSLPRVDILTQSHAMIGAKMIRNIELIDWYQLLGK